MLKVFKASAGSGKTYRLTEFYLLICFKNHHDHYYFRRILAMTFTNDATAEMKERILQALHALASGDDNAPYLDTIMKAEGKGKQWVRQKAGRILDAMMEYYDQFSISTIDSFFQRVLKIFTRELKIQGGYELEMNVEGVLDEAMDLFVDTLDQKNKHLEWVNKVLLQQNRDQKGTNFRRPLKKLGKELFKEGVDDILRTMNQSQLIQTYEDIQRIKGRLEAEAKEIQDKAREVLSKEGLSPLDFSGASKSFVSTWLNTFDNDLGTAVRRMLSKPPKTMIKAQNNPDKWLSKANQQKPISVAVDRIYEDLNYLLIEYVSFIGGANARLYMTLREMENDFSSFAFLTILEEKVQQHCAKEGKMLISRTASLLSDVIKLQILPFFYEQLGNRYDHILLDEFQDTSESQWENLQVLVENAVQMQGKNSLIVGDVKQAIYRWRNGNWRILHEELKAHKGWQGLYEEEPIKENWRSLQEIVDFNNNLYNALPDIADHYLEDHAVETDAPIDVNLHEMYTDHQQKLPEPLVSNRQGGYIECWGYRKNKKVEKEDQEAIYWEHLKHKIIDVQERGYSKGDICILVRKAKHSKEVGAHLLAWQEEQPSDKNWFTFASNDVLQLNKSHAVQAVMAFFQLLLDPDNGAAKGEWVQAIGYLRKELLIDYRLASELNQQLKEELEQAGSLSLWEISDRVITSFQLGRHNNQIPFLQFFQELVYEFSQKGKGHLMEFISWWKEEGEQKTLQIPSDQDAIKIMTVHKSKGLQFPVIFALHHDWGVSALSDSGNMPNFVWTSKIQLSEEVSLPSFPIEFRKLKYTTQVQDFNQELAAQVVDNMNLLYVATTRAQSELYISLRNINDKGKVKTMADLMDRFIQSHFSWEAVDEEKDMWRCNWGTATHLVTQKREEDSEIKSFTIYHGGRPIPPISGQFSRKDFEEEQSMVLHRGKKLHRLFEGLRSLEDVDQQLVAAREEGWIEEKEWEPLRQSIQQLFDQQEVAALLSLEGELLTERELLLPTGELLRPDRVVLQAHSTIIIDFKTGEHYPKNEQQIKQYHNVLDDMGYPNVKSFLLYLDQGKIIKTA